MAVGPIGSAIFTNHMTPAVSANQNAHDNRVDFQNMIAQAATQEKDEKVLEVRPAEENQEVDADREHAKNEADQESQRGEKREPEEEESDAEMVHKLDITV